MSGYRGDGYGQYGNVGDDDFRWGEGERPPEHGAARGNLMGRAEHEARDWFGRGDDDQGRREGSERLADDPRAVRAADEWRQRFGREGFEGSYAQHDETYRSYRERHLAELDNDYQEYCQERGLEFGSAFDNWRRNRQAGGAVPAMAGVGGAPEGGFTDGATVGLNEGAGMSEGGAASTEQGEAAQAPLRSPRGSRTR
jgi:hypothetical protein